MGFVELKQHIKKQAEKEKKDIIEKAQLKASQIRSGYEKELEAVHKKTLKEGMTRALLLEKEIIGEANVQSKAEVIQTQSEIISDVFKQAAIEINKMPSEKKSSLLTRLIDKADLGSGAKKVIVSPEYAGLISHKKGVEIVEKELGELG
ncbi:MAG: hypothetical protein GF334_05780, partial [Candidatus Altiarchaeales archaeon]|nr:hypothetical protein [Candidatus Altiarchaeales archaeon]